ncbi:MAG TPA: metallophosphoesterase [Cyclobacteriaceae bacterium]|nr:metallophosphoesterase [Cyclobacteriaceae bacterium]
MHKILLLLFAIGAITAKAQTITGFVFVDSNNNGNRDGNEAGVAGVAVSDQATVVVTDNTGKYQIKPQAGQAFLVITLPDGHKAPQGFWKRIESNTTINFPLTKTAVPSEFSFIHASDTHISEQSVGRTVKLRELTNSLKPDFVLVCGDLVRDALRVPEEEAKRYYQLYVDNIKQFTVPVWSVPGNHELFGIERHLSLVSPKNPLYGRKMFAHYIGPNYYSFNYGGIHFIGLDDVDFEDTWYYGRIDSLQMSWLKQDLAALPAKTPVVTFKHIPDFSGGLSLSTFEESGPGRSLEREDGVLQFRHVVSNAHQLTELLQTHPYPLSLSGHYHARQVFRYESTGQNTRFEQTAAVVGEGGEGNIVMKSGVVLYKVKNGLIDEGKFIPLD